jgi:hypothetical protein
MAYSPPRKARCSFSAGVLIGFGLSAGTSASPIVIGAFGKLLPVELAHLVLRHRHGGELVRAVSVFAACGQV